MLYWLIDFLKDRLPDESFRYVMVLEQIQFRAFVAGFLCFAIVLFCAKPVIRRLIALKIGDSAQFDVAALNDALKSKANTPTMGGVLIAGAIGVSILFTADLSNSYIIQSLIVLVWLACVGGVDDWLKLTAARRPGGSRQGLYSWEKLVFQLGLGLIVGYFAFSAGGSGQESSLANAVNLPFQKTYTSASSGPNPALWFLPVPLFVIWMTLVMSGLSNAVNITDGMDGLATGISAFVALGLMVLCFVAGYENAARYLLVPYIPTTDELAIVSAAIAGACLGFLWWNASPASVFMGDTGSLCLGGLIGYIAVVIRQEFVVFVMCGVFIMEIASVVLQVGYFKATKGKRIFRCAPYHWHLHMGGWQEQKIVSRFYIITLVLVAVALASLKVR
ncbi:MAG: phospho-N-acetylmuramoyl-pentapeptide-transferase [Phycisphaerales bacterium]